MSAESFTAIRWRCPHCRRSWSSKARANAHVAACWLDPANRTCKTCAHHWIEAPTYDEPGGEGCNAGANIYDPEGELSDGRFYVQVGCPEWGADR